MKVEHLSVEHFKPYEDTDLTLSPGVTVIHGLNGSGKSSLLEAMFFALYGTDALEGPTADAVTTGEDTTRVELAFSHDGKQYSLERELRIQEGRVSRHDCTLETPEETIDGVTDVEKAITALLRMDSEAFLNCAYVRQGDVNALIDATPDERQDMIDALLQLGALERYRERAADARLGVEDVLADRRSRLDQLESDIAEAEAEELPTKLNELESDIANIESEIDRLEDNREAAQESLSDAEETLNRYEERREELEAIEEDIEQLEAEIQEIETERKSLQETIESHREMRDEAVEEAAELGASLDIDDPDQETVAEKRSELANKLEDCREELGATTGRVESAMTEKESALERADDLEQRASEHRERMSNLEDTVDDLEREIEAARERLEEHRQRKHELEETLTEASVDRDQIPTLVETRQEELTAARERVAELQADLERARERLDEAKTLIDRGECPRCGQPVSDDSHADVIAERREAVTNLESQLESAQSARADAEESLDTARELAEALDKLESVETEIADIEDTIETRQAEREEAKNDASAAKEEAERLESEAEAAREEAAEAQERAAAARDQIGELNAEIQRLEENIETADKLGDVLSDRAEAETEIERCRERRELLAERASEYRETLTERQSERRELAEQVDKDTIEEARTRRDEAAEYLEEVEAELETLSEQRSELVGKRGAVEEALSTLEDRRDRAAQLRTVVDRLEGLYEEITDLESLYGQLRADLRQQNVETLETLLNETFELVYGNDSYARIELSASYEFTVYQKDGDTLEPDQLSGGERALFNLSLRCAVYQLLAEGVEGNAPLPPLVLDEPTVFLDDGHVSRLLDLIDAMRTDVGVEQIIVVSHDDELAGAADDLVRVEKDPRTNRSHVSQAEVGTAD